MPSSTMLPSAIKVSEAHAEMGLRLVEADPQGLSLVKFFTRRASRYADTPRFTYGICGGLA